MKRWLQFLLLLLVAPCAFAYAPQPVVANFTYDPEVEFLMVGVGVSEGTASRQDVLTYGPDLSGRYGGMQGVGGLEAVTTTGFGGSTVGVLNDGFGNVMGAITNGVVGWNGARLGLYGPREGYAPPRLSLSAPTHASLAWRTRPVTAANLVQLGKRPYDPVRRAFLSADPLGHGSDAALNTAFAGNPAAFFDADGRMGVRSGGFDSFDTLVDNLKGSYGIYWKIGLANYGFSGVGYDQSFGARLAAIQSGGLYGGYDLDNRSFGARAGSYAADTFLNASALQESFYELRNPDFSSGWGIATFAVAGVSFTANVADAAANVVPGKAVVENSVKTGIKGVTKLFVKDAAKEAVETGLKDTANIAERRTAESLVNWVDEGGNLKAGGSPGMRPDAYRFQSGTPGARSSISTGRPQAPYLEFADESGNVIGAKFDGVQGMELIDRKLNPFFSPKAVDEATRQAAVARYYGLQAVWELPTPAAVSAANRFMQSKNITGITVRLAK